MNDRHEWVQERLSEHLDGLLGPSEAARVQRHLETCEACQDLRAGLSEVRRLARDLRPIDPPRDLWPRIEAARAARARSTRFSFSLPQLAAAAIVLITVSASSAWWVTGGRHPDAARGSGPGATADPVVAMTAAPASAVVSEELAAELGMLEAALSASHDRLDPHTVHVLERNLLVIERAIEDSYQALALDPENEFVRAHLQRTYERKLEYLREVSVMVDLAG